jgi:hypothetical protein
LECFRVLEVFFGAEFWSTFGEVERDGHFLGWWLGLG